MLPWNAAVLRTGDSIPTEATGVKPFANGSGCNLTDLRYLSSGEDHLHGRLLHHMQSMRTRKGGTFRERHPHHLWLAIFGLGSFFRPAGVVPGRGESQFETTLELNLPITRFGGLHAPPRSRHRQPQFAIPPSANGIVSFQGGERAILRPVPPVPWSSVVSYHEDPPLEAQSHGQSRSDAFCGRNAI